MSRRFVVLVVDDDMFVRTDIAETFSLSGWHVFEANSAEQALELCDAGVRVDVLVTDINLGRGTTGWDVAQAFWQRAPIPVLYMSGNSDSPDLHVPGSSFMTKPCRPPELMEQCRRLQARHNGREDG